jgi:hypothetical protein
MSFANNPWSEEFWNLTEQGQYITQYGLEVAKTKARQAGTRLGAPRKRPAPLPPVKVLVQRRDFISSGGPSGGSSGNGPPA